MAALPIELPDDTSTKNAGTAQGSQGTAVLVCFAVSLPIIQ